MERLGRPVYAPLWAAVRRRVEANGLSLEGTPVTLRNLTAEQADAIAGLLGVRRPSPGAPLRFRLGALDRALRTSSLGCGLLEALTSVGGPPVDRRAAKSAIEAELAEQWASLVCHPAVVHDDRLAGWLDHVRAAGLDRRLAGAEANAAVRTALDVLMTLARDDGRRRLAVLAADATGDAHALDRGRPTGTLVVHALSWVAERPFPQDAADWRRAWADAGVACDDLSCDVLVLNLPGWPSEPLRLTLRQVVAWKPPMAPRPDVFACENPAVVAAAADHVGVGSSPLVCIDGMPSTAALVVLERLGATGATIRYHGDFDWRGLAIASVVARKLPSVMPWRYTAADYERAVARGLGTMELVGRAASSPWDPGLADAMMAAGLAIYEEQVVADLLADLAA